MTPTTTLPSQTTHQFSRIQTVLPESAQTHPFMQTSSAEFKLYGVSHNTPTCDSVISSVGQSSGNQSTHINVAFPTYAVTSVSSHVEEPPNGRKTSKCLQAEVKDACHSEVKDACHLTSLEPMPVHLSSSSPHIPIIEKPSPRTMMSIYDCAFKTRTEIISSTQTSPTSINMSPLLTSSVRQLVTTPSPPLSGTNTPHGGVVMNTTGYPPSQIIYNIAPPYSPNPTYQFYYNSGSAGASPVPPSPRTPKKLYGSYTAVNRASNEQESLTRWLKSLRLHKYYSIFDNITFEEVSE